MSLGCAVATGIEPLLWKLAAKKFSSPSDRESCVEELSFKPELENCEGVLA